MEERPANIEQLPDIVGPADELDLRGRLGARRFAVAATRWAFLACVTGLVAGAGASLFIAGLDLIVRGVNDARNALPWWLIFLFPPVGGFAVGALLWRSDRDAFVSACGTDSFIDAVEEADGRISPLVPVLRIIGAWLTLGFGGSSGRECPMIYTGAGLGSTVGKAFERGRRRLSAADTRMLALCGAAGALGAVFSAPFGGAIFAIEVPYRRDISVGFLWPALVSSFTGFAVGGALVGRQRLLRLPPLHTLHAREWLLVAVIAVLAALVGRVFAWTFDTLYDAIHRIDRVPPWCRTGVGALLAGIVMIAFPQVYGIGYDAIRATASGTLFANHAVVAAALLFAGMGVAKMLATSLTVGTGGVGGLLFPSMFTGAAVGGLVSRLAAHQWPGRFPHEAAYVVIAMSATYAAAGKVPLASLLLVCEATANFSLALPMAVANAIAYALSGRSTVYDVQRPRSESGGGHGYVIGVVIVACMVVFAQHVVSI